MNLRALRIFKAVVDEGGDARAAERLHCVQSNVSIRIKQLEEMLDTRLFERAGKRLTVTPRGVVLLSYAERLLQLADETKQVMKAGGTTPEKLRIGAFATTAALHLPRALADFSLNHPSVQLCVKVATTEHILQDVLAKNLDMGLVIGPVHHRDLVQTQVFEEELVLLTNLMLRDVRSASDVRNKMLIGFRSGCTYQTRALQWLKESGICGPRILEFDTSEAIISCVEAGLGVSVMPQTIVDKWGISNKVSCHSLPKNLSRAETMLIWRRDSQHYAARHAFTECLLTLSLPEF